MNRSVLQYIILFYERYFSLFFGFFCILSAIMLLHTASALRNSRVAAVCMWLFIFYFMWYDIYAKNKKIAIIPLLLYLLGYYIINWTTMCEVFQFFGHLISGI